MRCKQGTFFGLSTLLLLSHLSSIAGETLKDIFISNTPESARVPRDNKYYSNRYGSTSSNPSPLNRAIKPEDSPEARETAQNPVEKRCTRCDSSYSDTRNPYDSRARFDRDRYRDRYDQDDRRDRYDDRRYDRYDDRDRYERRPSYDRYDRDRYDRYDRDRYDRYDRDRYDRDRYDGGRDRYYDRDYDRGFGYDNRGYDNRDRGYGDYEVSGAGRGYYPGGGRPETGPGYWGTSGYASGWNYGGDRDRDRDSRDPYNYEGFRPWDETYKGSSGWDSNGRGYYFASGIPEAGAGHWGTQKYPESSKFEGGSGYRDKDRDRYGGGGGGSGGGYYRPRDPYDGYRSTSYLYGRPSTTTNKPSTSGDSDSATQSPQESSSG